MQNSGSQFPFSFEVMEHKTVEAHSRITHLRPGRSKRRILFTQKSKDLPQDLISQMSQHFTRVPLRGTLKTKTIARRNQQRVGHTDIHHVLPTEGEMLEQQRKLKFTVCPVSISDAPF